jgi:hypothetical protein
VACFELLLGYFSGQGEETRKPSVNVGDNPTVSNWIPPEYKSTALPL